MQAGSFGRAGASVTVVRSVKQHLELVKMVVLARVDVLGPRHGVKSVNLVKSNHHVVQVGPRGHNGVHQLKPVGQTW